MSLFNKAEKTNTTISLGTSICQFWIWLGGASMLGSVLGWLSPIVDVLGKPLSAVVGAILCLLLYAVIQKIYFGEKSKSPRKVSKAVLEISFIDGVSNVLTHENIKYYSGFKDVFPLSTGFKRTHCTINFSYPMNEPKTMIHIKEKGIIALQKQLGIQDSLSIINNGMTYGVVLVIDGANIDNVNGHYVISFEET